MSLKPTKHIWFNGKLVPWDDANIHVLTYALHYGTAVFEGIRAYSTNDGCKIFRLHEHTKRLLNSAKIYKIRIPYSQQELEDACRTIISSNGLTNGAYIRPIAFKGYGDLGLHVSQDDNIEVAIAAWEWGTYLGKDALNDGVDVCISSWTRAAPNTIPVLAKAAGNYLSGILITEEAHQNGFDEGIALDTNGMVSEGAGENIFMVKDSTIYTPPIGSSILDGITRDSVMKLAESMGMEVKEMQIPREQLYIADELFFTGTAVEVTPVRSVDRITIGTGNKGPVTSQIQKAFFGLFDGSTKDSWGWLEPIQ